MKLNHALFKEVLQQQKIFQLQLKIQELQGKIQLLNAGIKIKIELDFLEVLGWTQGNVNIHSIKNHEDVVSVIVNYFNHRSSNR